MTPEETLAKRVHDVCGPWIAEAVAGTPYPASLLGALSANESGGDPTKTRFEPAVFGKLAQVLASTVPAHPARYGAIGGEDLLRWCDPPQPPGIAPRAFKESLIALINLATSWGPTQIMGYESLAGGFALSELVNVQTHYKHAVNLLDGFRKEFRLYDPLFNPPFTAEQYFRCWNTGRPDGQTADDQYVPNGLARMKLYEAIT